jgi:hypothetical protein
MNEKNEGNIPLKDRIDDNEEIDVKDQNDNKEQSSSVNEQKESSQLKDETKIKPNNNNKSCCQRFIGFFFSTGDEIWFALTFIGRILMTLYSFHGLFFIYNFIIQFIILIPGRLYDLDSIALQWIFGIFYILFSWCASNLLVVPTYELLLFPYLYFRNPMAHLHSLFRVKYVINDEKEKLKNDGTEESIENQNKPILNILLILIGILYLIGLILSFIYSPNLKDYVKIVILFFIYTYYTVLMTGYGVVCFYFSFKLFQFSYRVNKGFWNIFVKSFDLNRFFGDPERKKVKITDENVNENKNVNNTSVDDGERDLPPLPRLNLLSYAINPILMKSYQLKDRNKNTEKKHCEDYFLYIKNISRMILFLYALLLIIIDLANKNSKKEPLAIIFFIIFFVIILILSMVLNFPVCCRNKKSFGVGGFFSGKVKYKTEYKMRHPNMVTFVRFLCNVIITLCAILLFAIFNIFKESHSLEKLYDFSIKTKKGIVDTTNLLLPNVCYSSIHHIPIYLFMPFINDAYYYDNRVKDYQPYYHSSLQIPSYKEFFFDETYKIEKIQSLIDGIEGESVKMIQYNVRLESGKKELVTILAIKGTTNKKDVFIDFQLYFPSVLLNLLSTFSLQGQQKESLSFKFIEYSLSVPYRIFFQYSLVQSYLNDLQKAYLDNYDSFYKNIIIVGHSLGGGLAKLLGRLLNRQAISLSGPGVNAFHSLWGYGGNSENFEISAIDLVPDMDLVPRVEVSGGTIYRIICKSGPFDCHSKEKSQCEILIMCRNPNYYNYCKEIANLTDEEIKNLYESSELNFNYEK